MRWAWSHFGRCWVSRCGRVTVRLHPAEENTGADWAVWLGDSIVARGSGFDSAECKPVAEQAARFHTEER